MLKYFDCSGSEGASEGMAARLWAGVSLSPSVNVRGSNGFSVREANSQHCPDSDSENPIFVDLPTVEFAITWKSSEMNTCTWLL